MELDNALYALAQIAHNFGAVAVIGLPLAALRYNAPADMLRKVYMLTLAAWLVQIASGVGFGMVSYFVVGELPQIHGLALAALVTKIICAVLSIAIFALALVGVRAVSYRMALAGGAGLGALALFCAAVLRWFS